MCSFSFFFVELAQQKKNQLKSEIQNAPVGFSFSLFSIFTAVPELWGCEVIQQLTIYRLRPRCSSSSIAGLNLQSGPFSPTNLWFDLRLDQTPQRTVSDTHVDMIQADNIVNLIQTVTTFSHQLIKNLSNPVKLPIILT